jgi:site-specific DNA-methyltransferase (adenine-specific)/modification methylase
MYDAADNSRRSYDVAVDALRERLERSKVEIGPHTLYCEDAEFILRSLPMNSAIVSDPPYGIGYQRGSGGNSIHSRGFSNDQPVYGDDKPFDPSACLKFSEVLLWGANHYSQRLPHGRWLAWNKLGDLQPWDDFCDVEFAWQNKRAADRIFSHLWKGLCQKGAGVRRWHPTQKPVELMEWCIGFTSSDTVIDPFMGSGTTGVACVKLGRKFIGIERDPKHFATAVRRIEEAMNQPDLFIQQPKSTKIAQEALF